ncbi:MAG: cobyrinate a,c-diamide synthase [ANME-2 cluster archaeon]|nr:cobyrinate a,c-diamide synthase [ANME-2 cluster archaeon]MDF1531118.1 cobyrinate a,c-diamide synthase [ANME-2 cluster archaeon]
MTKAVMIAGTHSGVGKTTVALGLMALLARRGMAVQPYKVGPDFIDPSHHTAICNRPSRNLDTYIMGTGGVQSTYARTRGDISIIEGVMGLYDGLDSSDTASSAHVAKILGVPVVLVVNVHGMSRSAAAVVKGYQTLDPDINIAGLILNRVGSPRHSKLVEDACKGAGIDIPVIGTLPSNKELSLPSRHLGLHMAHEQEWDYNKLADFIEHNMDVDVLLDISQTAREPDSPGEIKTPQADVRIGVASDSAFCFYYQDMFDELEQCGAEIITFSPMSDPMPDIDGLILGGGYPELFSPQLSASNTRYDIRKAAQDGMPVYAECGGLMYLGTSLERDGKTYEMAGVFDSESRMVQRFQALGYTEAEVIADNHLSGKGQTVRGHEFHYSITEPGRDARFAYRMRRGKGIFDGQDGLMVYNTLASYMHTHPAAVSMERFVNSCREYSRK